MKIPRHTFQYLLVAATLFAATAVANGQNAGPANLGNQNGNSGSVLLRLVDGSSIRVDDAWESEQGIWYRQSGMSHLIGRDRIKAIDRSSGSPAKAVGPVARVVEPGAPTVSPDSQSSQPVWIYLVGGARVEADSAIESAAGVWFQRGPLAVFVERSRIDHVERETLDAIADSNSSNKERGWTTGNQKLDGLIRQSGA